MREPRCSLIVPVHNGSRWLGAALRSAVEQSRPPDEIVVVDDGSTDDSAQIAEGVPGTIVIRQGNVGPAAARNRGVASSSGDLIAFLDADDLLPRDKLRTQISYLSDHPEIGCVLGRQVLTVEPGVTLPAWASGGDLDAIARGQIPPASIVLHRCVWDAVGPFDTALRVGEDTDWLLRASDLGIKVAAVDDVVLIRRLHGSNLTYDNDGIRHGFTRALKARLNRKRAMSSLVSVVIPLHNQADVVRESVASALSQTPTAVEVVLVDDGSTDDGLAMVAPLGVRTIAQPHGGSSAARNRGFAATTGPFVTFLDADDRMTEGRLAAQLAVLEQHPEWGGVYGDVTEFVTGEPVVGHRSPRAPRPARLAGSFLFRAETWAAVGPLAEDIPRGEFIDWMARADDLGVVFGHAPGVVLERRLHPGNGGIRRDDSSYPRVLKDILDRRRNATATGSG
jgi:glycosyltransferase involved in cell wall biosynthesis